MVRRGPDRVAKFSKVKRPARMARNPATGEAVRVKATTVAKITPLKGFKDVVLGVAAAPKLTKPRPVAAKKTAAAKKPAVTTNTTGASAKPAAAIAKPAGARLLRPPRRQAGRRRRAARRAAPRPRVGRHARPSPAAWPGRRGRAERRVRDLSVKGYHPDRRR